MLRDATLLAFSRCSICRTRSSPLSSKSEDVLLIHEPKSCIFFRSLDSFERIRGTTLAWFGVDELTYRKPESWLRLEGRLLRLPRQNACAGSAILDSRGIRLVFGSASSAQKNCPAMKPSERNRIQRCWRLLRTVLAGTELRPALLSTRSAGGISQRAAPAGQAYYPFLRSDHIRPVEYKPDQSAVVVAGFQHQSYVLGNRSDHQRQRPRAGGVGVLTYSNIVLAACEEFLARTEKWVQAREVPMPPGFENMGIIIPPLAPLNVYVYGDATGRSRFPRLQKHGPHRARTGRSSANSSGATSTDLHVQIRVGSGKPDAARSSQLREREAQKINLANTACS